MNRKIGNEVSRQTKYYIQLDGNPNNIEMSKSLLKSWELEGHTFFQVNMSQLEYLLTTLGWLANCLGFLLQNTSDVHHVRHLQKKIGGKSFHTAISLVPISKNETFDLCKKDWHNLRICRTSSRSNLFTQDWRALRIEEILCLRTGRPHGQHAIVAVVNIFTSIPLGQ